MTVHHGLCGRYILLYMRVSRLEGIEMNLAYVRWVQSIGPGSETTDEWEMLWVTSNVTSRHRGPKLKLRAGYRAPSLQRTSYVCGALLCCARYILSVKCGVALSLRDACIRSSGIIFTPRAPLCKISFFIAAPIAELARGENSHTQIIQSLTQLIWCFWRTRFFSLSVSYNCQKLEIKYRLGLRISLTLKLHKSGI